MNDNPYAKIIDLFQEEEKTLDSIGIITSLSPLKIEIGDLIIDKDNILINNTLVEHNTELEVTTTTDIVDSHSHPVEFKEEIDITNKLKVGDKVLIFRNGQKFIVVCKVVNA